MAAALTSSGTAISMKQLLEAGVHFGHQTKRWNPKMKPYIFGARNGIYIIDLQKTVGLARERAPLRLGRRGQGRLGALHRHQEAGPGRRPRGGLPLRPVLRDQPLAGRHAHQLQDHQDRHRAAQDAGEDEGGRHLRPPPQEGGRLQRARAREAGEEPGRHQGPAPAPGRHLRHRHQEGAHRGARGQPARHPGGGGGRHQLRPRGDRLRDPGQRRRHPLHPALHRQGRRGLPRGQVAPRQVGGRARRPGGARRDDRDAASERGSKDRRDRGGRGGGQRRERRDDRGAASANVEVLRKGEVAPAPPRRPRPRRSSRPLHASASSPGGGPQPARPRASSDLHRRGPTTWPRSPPRWCRSSARRPGPA